MPERRLRILLLRVLVLVGALADEQRSLYLEPVRQDCFKAQRKVGT